VADTVTFLTSVVYLGIFGRGLPPLVYLGTRIVVVVHRSTTKTTTTTAIVTTRTRANNIFPQEQSVTRVIKVSCKIYLENEMREQQRYDCCCGSVKGNGSIDNSRGVWRKKTVEKVKKKRERERDRDEKRPFRFSVRILIYFRERPLFPVRGRFTLRTSIVYGRIFTTQTPFYNVAISKVYSSQQPENGTIVGGFGP